MVGRGVVFHTVFFRLSFYIQIFCGHIWHVYVPDTIGFIVFKCESEYKTKDGTHTPPLVLDSLDSPPSSVSCNNSILFIWRSYIARLCARPGEVVGYLSRCWAFKNV